MEGIWTHTQKSKQNEILYKLCCCARTHLLFSYSFTQCRYLTARPLCHAHLSGCPAVPPSQFLPLSWRGNILRHYCWQLRGKAFINLLFSTRVLKCCCVFLATNWPTRGATNGTRDQAAGLAANTTRGNFSFHFGFWPLNSLRWRILS